MQGSEAQSPNTQPDQELVISLLVRITLFFLSWSLLPSPRLSDTPSVSRGGRYPVQQSLPSPSWTYHCCRGRACQITPTILASCPQNIRFLQLMCAGGVSSRQSPPPSSIRPVLFGVLLSRLVLIDFFFPFFLSFPGRVNSWMLKSRGSINCRPSRGRGRQNWSRNAAGSSSSARTWRPATSCRRKLRSR